MSLILATVQILRDAGVADGRVYGVKIPDRETAHMPRKAVTVRGSRGGVPDAGGYMPTGDQRLDIKCFGADPGEERQRVGWGEAVQAVVPERPDRGAPE